MLKRLIAKLSSPTLNSRNKLLRMSTKGILLILFHPKAVWKSVIPINRFRQGLLKNPITKKLSGISFEFNPDYGPIARKMFQGTYEIPIIELMKRFLKEGDTFIDAGANIGYLSAIALGLVGKTGQVHSFEPVPEYFLKLEKLKNSNSDYDLIINNTALSDHEGQSKMNVHDRTNIGCSTLVPNLIDNESINGVIEVKTKRLDKYIEDNGVTNISLVKIDTEGYELFVLRGLNHYFDKTEERPAIIVEISPEAFLIMGYSLSQLSEYMSDFGYRSYSVYGACGPIDIIRLKVNHNVIFLP